EIVRDSPRQPSDGLHLQGLVELFARAPEILDVSTDTKPAENAAVVIAHGKSAGEKPAVFAFAASDTTFGFVDRPGSHGVGPLRGGFSHVLVMQDGGPLLSHGLLDGEARVVIPPLIA